jgi:hypothetical protein
VGGWGAATDTKLCVFGVRHTQGKKRLHALSVTCAAAIALPFAVLSHVWEWLFTAATAAAPLDAAAAAAAATTTAAPTNSLASTLTPTLGVVGSAVASSGHSLYPTPLSVAGYLWSVALIAVFYVVLKFYLDAQVFEAAGGSAGGAGSGGVNGSSAVSAASGAASSLLLSSTGAGGAANGAGGGGALSGITSRHISVPFHFVVMICSACVLDLYRGEGGLTPFTLASAVIVYWGKCAVFVL